MHVIFSTKNRTPSILPDYADSLYGQIGGISRERGSHLLCAGGMPDHIHLLVQFGREQALKDYLRDIKSLSSGWMSTEFGIPFSWQAGYAAFSVSRSIVTTVEEYILGQENHHRKRTFQDELRLFLKRHKREYDERYVWD